MEEEAGQAGDLNRYFKKKCEELDQLVQEKRINLQRLEAQRNELNGVGKVCALTDSEIAEGGASSITGAGIISWRGGEANGEEESPG